MPTNSFDNKRLRDAVLYSDKHRMKGMRHLWHEIMQAYAGSMYPGRRDGNAERTPEGEKLNTIYQIANIIVPQLYMQNPTPQVTHPDIWLQEQADILGAAVLKKMDQLGLEETMREVIMNALCGGVGVVKVGMTRGSMLQQDDVDEVLNGELFIDCVSIDDYIIDPQARSLRSMAFEGNKWLASLDALRELDVDRDVLKAAEKHAKDGLPDHGRLSGYSQTQGLGGSDYKDHIELVDVWVPEADTMYTYLCEGDFAEPLMQQEYRGYGNSGPFEKLVFRTLPDNAVPVPHLSVIYELHQMINKAFLKLERQFARSKKIMLAQRGAEDDADTVRDARDGSIVMVNNPAEFVEASMGGIDEENNRALQNFMDLQSRFGGNTDLLGGIAAESDTATQDQMLAMNATVLINDMRYMVKRFLSQVAKRVAWHLWNDPVGEPMPVVMDAGGASYTAEFSAQEAVGEFDDFEFDVDIYSARATDPEAEKRERERFIASALPLITMAMQQGMFVDVLPMIRALGKYMDIDEIEQMIPGMENMMQAQQGIAGPGQVNIGGNEQTVNMGGSDGQGETNGDSEVQGQL